MSHDEELAPHEGDLGPCCACEGTERVRNIVMLEKRAPAPGTGWGCVLCRLPVDGAIAVLCDGCIEVKRPARFVIRGYVRLRQREPIENLSPEPFKHRVEFHPEELVEIRRKALSN